MPVYCSNFYSSLQCRNFAPRFGERCGFCTVHKRGRALKEGLLPRRTSMWSPSHTPEDEDIDSDDSWTNIDGTEEHSPRQRRRRGARTRSA